jgi:integrase
MTFRAKLDKDYDDFLKLRESLGYTVENWTYIIPSFIEFCSNMNPDAEHITKDMVDAWIVHKNFKTNGTQSNNIFAVRAFLKYQTAKGESPFIPGDEYSVGQEKYIPYIFNDEELRKLFVAIDNLPPYNNSPCRHYIVPVMFRMMYCCGMRPQEPASLICDDVNLETGEIFIRQSKGHKDRRILMSPDLTNLCRQYNLRMRPRKYFFEDADGDKYDSWWVRYQFKVCWRNTGLKKRGRLRPYDLRHNFATRTLMRWVNEGRDINLMAPYLSAYMGHRHFSDTLYYFHLIPEHLLISPAIDWSSLSSIYPGGGA